MNPLPEWCAAWTGVSNMGNEAGTWVMHGVLPEDPCCIHTVDQLTEYIEEVGFLPLFKNEIPGFSVEERTVSENWWSGNKENDPWAWREIIAAGGKIAYGKFFNKKAGFISMEWLPHFVNYRRDGYDFDARWEDGIASRKTKKIMDLFLTGEEGEDTESKISHLSSPDIKKRAGFGKDGEKNFDGTLTELQMQLYLCPADFRQRINKAGKSYGWPVAVYATPEQLYGYDHVRSQYKESPENSAKKIYESMKERYPEAVLKDILKVLGLKKVA